MKFLKNHSYLKSFFVFVLFVIIFIFVSIVLQFLFIKNYFDEEFFKLFLSLTFLIPTIIISILFRIQIKLNYYEAYSIYIMILPLALSIQIMGSAFMIWFIEYLPEGYSSYYESIQKFLQPKSKLDLFFTLVSVGIIGPTCEEFVFRGVILSKLLENKNTFFANVFQSLLFGIAHMNLIQFLYAIPIGMFFGWIFIKTKNLFLSILIHIFTNSTAILLLAFDFDHPLWNFLKKYGSESISFRELPKEPIYVSMVILVLFIYLIKKNYKFSKYS